MKPIKYMALLALTVSVIGCGGGGGGKTASSTTPPQNSYLDVKSPYEATYGPITNLSGYDKNSVFIENEVRKIAYIGANIIPFLISNSSYNSWDEIRQQIMTKGNKLYLTNNLSHFTVDSVTDEFVRDTVVLKGSDITFALPKAKIIETATQPSEFNLSLINEEVTLVFFIDKSNNYIGYRIAYRGVDTRHAFAKSSNGDYYYQYIDDKNVPYEIKHDVNSQLVTIKNRPNNKIEKTGTYNQSNDTISGL